MRFVTFRTPKPKSFHYIPRYYDPELEALERKKAALGLSSKLSHQETLRVQMSRKWHKRGGEDDRNRTSKIISYSIYAFVILGGLYLILFTDMIEKLVAVFTAGR